MQSQWMEKRFNQKQGCVKENDMNKVQIEELAKQACVEGVLEIECPVCKAIITTEPNTTDIYCLKCEEVTGQNPLTRLGFI